MSGTTATIGNGGLQALQQGLGDLQQALAEHRNQIAQAYYGGQAAPVPAYDNFASFRALRLLWRHLTPEQRGQYKLFSKDIDHEGRSFIVRGNHSGHHYRIFQNGSVLRLKDQHRFCLQLIGEPVPPADMMLAKKLLLETDELLFLVTANDLTQTMRPARIEQRYAELEAEMQRARRVPPPEPPTPTTMGRRGRAFINRLLR